MEYDRIFYKRSDWERKALDPNDSRKVRGSGAAGQRGDDDGDPGGEKQFRPENPGAMGRNPVEYRRTGRRRICSLDGNEGQDKRIIT